MPRTLAMPDGYAPLIQMTRDDWDARPSRRPRPVDNPANNRHLVGHHFGDRRWWPSSSGDMPALWRRVQALHTTPQFNGTDVLYNLGLDPWGGFWDLRGAEYQNGANTPANSTTVSIVYPGDTSVTGQELTVAAKETLHRVMVWLGGVAVSACPGNCIIGHGDVGSTACPGASFRSHIQRGAPRPARPPVSSGVPGLGAALGAAQVAVPASVYEVIQRSYRLGVTESDLLATAIAEGNQEQIDRLAAKIRRRFAALAVYHQENVV